MLETFLVLLCVVSFIILLLAGSIFFFFFLTFTFTFFFSCLLHRDYYVLAYISIYPRLGDLVGCFLRHSWTLGLLPLVLSGLGSGT